jgi:hypothetical protein
MQSRDVAVLNKSIFFFANRLQSEFWESGLGQNFGAANLL